MDHQKGNIIWNLINSVGVVVLIPFAWNYIAVPQIEKIRDNAGFISKADAEAIIKENVLEERERQADNRTASLSWTVANALGIPREEIAPRVTALIKFGEQELSKHEEREQFWQEFESTRYIGIIQKEPLKLHYRWTDGDYLIRNERADDGKYHYFWIDGDNKKHYLAEISNAKRQ